MNATPRMIRRLSSQMTRNSAFKVLQSEALWHTVDVGLTTANKVEENSPEQFPSEADGLLREMEYFDRF